MSASVKETVRRHARMPSSALLIEERSKHVQRNIGHAPTIRQEGWH